jgi:hypothetical protein
MWFHEPSSVLEPFPPGSRRLLGVDASLLWLSQVWNSRLDSAPYHGILGFSQGAALACLLPLVTQKHYRLEGLRFIIAASGYIPSPAPEVGCGGAQLADHHSVGSVDLPTLHLLGSNNAVVAPQESLELARRFVLPKVVVHEHGHCIPSTKHVHGHVREFLCDRAMEVMRDYMAARDQDGNQVDVLSMQRRLCALESESMAMINLESGQNPPRALMAVIDRKEVGGWSGDRRVEPGGGAPCPSDFVKKVDEREGKSKMGNKVEKEKEKGWNEGGKADRSKPDRSKLDRSKLDRSELDRQDRKGAVDGRKVVQSQDEGDDVDVDVDVDVSSHGKD